MLDVSSGGTFFKKEHAEAWDMIEEINVINCQRNSERTIPAKVAPVHEVERKSLMEGEANIFYDPLEVCIIQGTTIEIAILEDEQEVTKLLEVNQVDTRLRPSKFLELELNEMRPN
ncbi:hypothetical protein M9H77_30413 [Catharanthus roseus]|uniref:Uncharacterized protein n=1 Tax=Catharanthus roseus TaxID=4058 RepID=A0ACB9ZY33_CATRO|nr:hypothetical protein M9H77_30413 [Catharanthus roseus]